LIIVSVFYLQLGDYDVDFEKQYAEYQTNQFDEYHPTEETLDYQPTRLSFTQVKE
jgi:hypothetical protein